MAGKSKASQGAGNSFQDGSIYKILGYTTLEYFTTDPLLQLIQISALAKENVDRVKIQSNLIQWYFAVQFNLLSSLINKTNDISIMQNEKLQ